ncbi:MAG TPA: hypothetical protein VFT74_09760 [Isosphaeraceae bacterium]|nr:hypothetical protein [Isosphaeraceae bacterium]
MPTLYLETNAIIAVAKGQHAVTDYMQVSAQKQIQLVIPGACIMEALSWLEG